MQEDSDSIPLSNNRCCQCRGNVSSQRDWIVSLSSCALFLLFVLGVSLVFFLGGLSVLRLKLSSASDGDGEKTRDTSCLSSCAEFSSVCKKCELGWTAYRGKCYFFSSEEQTWFESRDSCAASGAHLVVINSEEIQDFLVSKTEVSHWIGLTDLETEGRWVWVNNQTLQETGVEFWYKREYSPDEPDNWTMEDPSGENCAYLGNRKSYVDKWFDNSCNKKKKFICQKEYQFPDIGEN